LTHISSGNFLYSRVSLANSKVPGKCAFNTGNLEREILRQLPTDKIEEGDTGPLRI
jgi:hypothetical protein